MGMLANNLKTAVSSTLVLSLLALAGCNRPADAPQQSQTAAPGAAPGVQAAPYTPPSAEQLSQMVAPIALFPDKLVGQLLAGATYPEQISSANQWLAQNPSLKGDALQSAEAGQPWDVSVKSLISFPSVLSQMAANIRWTTALGEAYVNDPNDVMNAIQALRLRAQHAGTLKSSPHLRVSTTVRATPPSNYIEQSPSEPMVYSGPVVIPPPPQTIVIEPAEPDVVYVPHYNPAFVYGEPVAVYPGWSDRQPAYISENLVTTGVISFGVGVLVGTAISHHHDWGWSAWDVNWGAPRPGYEGRWHRPEVVYNNTTYISKSVTVVNHVNNVNVVNNNFNNSVSNNYRTTNNVVNRTQNFAIHNAPQPPAAMPNVARFQPNFASSLTAQPAAQRPDGPMTVPHFTTHDVVPGARPSFAAPAMHVAVAPHMNAVAAQPHVTPVAPAPRGLAFAPVLPHDQHSQPHMAQEMQAARMTPAVVNPPARQPASIDRISSAAADRGHADAARDRAPQAQGRGNATMHMPPMQRAEPAMAHVPTPHREVDNTDRSHAPAAHQDHVAMHTERPHGVQPAPVNHPAAKHAENNHHHDNQGDREHHS